MPKAQAENMRLNSERHQAWAASSTMSRPVLAGRSPGPEVTLSLLDFRLEGPTTLAAILPSKDGVGSGLLTEQAATVSWVQRPTGF